jgi:hypothetical protein
MTAIASHTALLLWGTDYDTLAVLNHVRDLRTDLSCAAEDLTPNGATGWKSSTHGLRDALITWTMVWDGTDAGLLAIRDAYLQDTPIVLWATDGLVATCVITAFARDERITDAIAVRVTARPTLAVDDPAILIDLYDIDAGTLVVDDITGDPVQVAA